MNFHPHIHMIVPGGGLDSKNHWKDNGEDFFLPVRVISKVFRGKYLAELKQLWTDGISLLYSRVTGKFHSVLLLCTPALNAVLFILLNLHLKKLFDYNKKGHPIR